MSAHIINLQLDGVAPLNLLFMARLNKARSRLLRSNLSPDPPGTEAPTGSRVAERTVLGFGVANGVPAVRIDRLAGGTEGLESVNGNDKRGAQADDRN